MSRRNGRHTRGPGATRAFPATDGLGAMSTLSADPTVRAAEPTTGPGGAPTAEAPEAASASGTAAAPVVTPPAEPAAVAVPAVVDPDRFSVGSALAPPPTEPVTRGSVAPVQTDPSEIAPSETAPSGTAPVESAAPGSAAPGTAAPGSASPGTAGHQAAPPGTTAVTGMTGVTDMAQVGTTPAPPPGQAQERVMLVGSTDAAAVRALAAGGSAPLVEPPRRRRGRRLRWSATVLLAGGVITLAVVQMGRPIPAPVLHSTVHLVETVPGTAPALPWPSAGEAAVDVPALGLVEQSGPEAPVPIASLTKIMTGYLTLRDHPLAPGAHGPSLVMTAADQTEAIAEDADGATNVPVQPGERLTERQLLNGLMVHSANDFADVLARWDAGTVPAFVTKMNSAAAALGMAHTRFADASGLSGATVGTPADLLRVTQAAMAIPTFAAVVDQPSITLPIAGRLVNYVQSVGTDGVVGVKSGFTQAAMGCLVMAADRTVGGRTVLMLAAVTGQAGTDPLSDADQTALRIVDAVAGGLHPLAVLAGGTRVGTVTTAWTRPAVAVVATAPATLVVWPGQVVRAGLSDDPVRTGTLAGAHVETVTVSAGAEQVRVYAQLAGSVRGPTLRWRLTRR